MIRSLILRIWKEMTEPISDGRRLILFGTISVVAFYFVWDVELKLTHLVQRNADDCLMLVSEAVNESGGNFVEARGDHADMLGHYLGQMEKRFPSGLLRRLYPKLSPEVQLRPVLERLRSGEGEPQKEIQVAAEAMHRFFSALVEYSDLRVAGFKHKDLPGKLVGKLNDALDNSHRTVKQYGENLDVDNAEVTCRANRTGIGLAYLVRCYSLLDRQRLKEFRQDIDRTIYYNGVLERSVSTSPKDRDLLRLYSKSEHHRLRIIQAILDSNMLEAKRLLETAIEQARREKKSE